MRYPVLFALAAAGCATTAGEPVNEGAAARLAGLQRTGEVKTCLNLTLLNEITAVDEKTLLIRSGANNWYVSDLKTRCRGVVGRGARIEYSTSLSQLCRNDILRIVDNTNGFLTGSCGMGSFERLEPKPAAE
ncbi:MAG TPA: hypothetical protein DDZ68_00080 [Parvularcula sp.]|nr:hypothetical protein [Parvularcula sp.]HBS31120.1 hypothetical protein [Parvularcula sp.]